MAPRAPRLHPALWALLAGASIAAACSGDEPTTQEQDHTEGEYVQANHPLYWNDSDFASFRGITDRDSWDPNPQPVGADDVAQRWLQHWADAIDAIVRAKVKADTGEELVAPKPVMHLLPASSISNAWVTAVPACVPWKVRKTGGAGTTSTTAGQGGGDTTSGGGGASSSSGGGHDATSGAGGGTSSTSTGGDDETSGAGGATSSTGTGSTGSGTGGAPAAETQPILFNHYGKKVQELGGSAEAGACIPRDDFAPFAETFLKEWNAGTPECAATLADDGAIEVAEGCMGSFEEAAKAAVYAISPHVQFSSDLLAAGTEAGAVFVVGHELAHFYRAHGSPLARHKYGFWYDQDARTARRPVPSAKAKELEALYKEIEAMPRAQAAEIPGATHTRRYRRVVVSSICSYVIDRADDADATPACAEAAALCHEVSNLQYASTATEHQITSYLALENELAACGEAETIGAIDGTAISALVVALQRDGYLQGGPVAEVPLPRKFGALLTLLQTTAAEQDAKVAAFAEKLRKGRIGLYTTEQEADDLAAEWVNKLGFTTDQAMDGWLEYLEYFDQGWRPEGEPSPNECRALYESGFKDGRAFVTVWLGDLDSAHHAGCYRVYNLWREQRAHAYVPAASIPRPDFATWEQVLEHAKQLSL